VPPAQCERLLVQGVLPAGVPSRRAEPSRRGRRGKSRARR
jgi:hypothetical protein